MFQTNAHFWPNFAVGMHVTDVYLVPVFDVMERDGLYHIHQPNEMSNN